MKSCYVAIALISSAAAQAAGVDHAALNQVYAELSRARAAHDPIGMARAFAPEGVLIDARPGPAILGGELEARLRPMAARIVADGVSLASAYRVERRSVMGDLAVDAGFMRQTTARPGGPTNVRYARFLVTMQRKGDGWQIVADASMPADEAAWTAVPRTAGLPYDG